MIIFLLKSTACMAIFLTFYKVLLENESMHQFKRFFLIAALVSSFIIPSIVFTEYIEIEPSDVSTQVLAIEQNIENQNIAKEVAQSPLNWSLALWTIYGIGVVGFGFRFIRHLIQLWSRIRNNPKLKQNSITNVLLKQQLPPHTFFNFIFLNKHKFETKSIPNSVLLHEETHALQKHSLDVLLIEFLQVLFWFNPVLYFFKKSIKLNHEFLADSAVLKNNEDQLNYQHTLLSYLSNGNYNVHQSVGIANAINYSSIKKRFIIMKKQTSKKGFLIRSLLLLPLLAIMLYGFSQKNIIAHKTIKDINIEITETGNLLVNDHPVLLENLSKEIFKINQNLEPYIIRNYLTANILYDENQYKLIERVQSEIQYTGISKIEHFSNKTSGINGHKPSVYNGKTVEEAKVIRRKNVFKEFELDIYNEPLLEIAWLEIKNENEIWFNDELIQFAELSEKLNSKYTAAINQKKLGVQIYTKEILDSVLIDSISEELRKLGTKSITVFNENKEYQETATKTQMADYNILAKKYNTMISKGGNIRIMKSDVDKLTNIYEIMSDEQKISAQPFPDFPEPPPAPNAPLVHRGEKSDIPPPPSPNVKKEDISNIPPPPTPPSPLDYVISMAKKGATFLYENKEISSNKAIELLKKNKDLNIESREKNGKAEVRITKEPVTIE
ncbi:M56 family metallopeptidase [Maribacter stanieri]|uniref:M56 family metallopeptidase n=1 Tax=Maribacter stanieri TaxID=440514 RepID=UPI0024943BBB|nr:M56 family metallopeptidase [Maribacter stanieri]|tara:strand:+ start:1349 stop:3352 length:2004 start_codon:yes stop_codon:yes gene_type:complete